MIDEQKLREKLAKILERPAYGSLHTFTRQPLIDRIVKIVKECEEPEAVTEEEAVEEPEPESKQKKKRRW